MKKLLLASALLCASNVSALAADAVVVETLAEVYVAPAFNWTGAYIGGQVGYLWGDGTVGPEPPETGSADAGPDGWLGGVYVGYNFQMANNVVIGADADFAWTGADDSAIAFAAGDPVGLVESELDWEGAVRARVGYAAGRFLPYIAGGVAFGQMNVAVFDETGDFLGEDDDTGVGWTIGAGLEYAFTDNLIGRAEYRYTDFGDFDFTFDDGDLSGDLSTSDVRLGIAYKF